MLAPRRDLESCVRDLRLTIYCLELKRKRAFRKFSYRGIDLEAYVLPT